jgi:hypothetical protein
MYLHSPNCKAFREKSTGRYDPNKGSSKKPEDEKLRNSEVEKNRKAKQPKPRTMNYEL